MPTKTVFITQLTTSSFIVPADFGSLVSIEALGAGGGADTGGSDKVPGGGGGAYAYSNYSANLAPGKVLQAYIPPGGEYVAQDPFNTYLRDPAAGFTYVSAASGKGSVNGLLGGAGGLVANCLGSGPFYSGGNGGTSGVSSQYFGKGGGGGAGGPGGNGGNGGNGAGNGDISQAGGGGGGAGVSSTGSTGTNGIQSTRGGNGGADGNGNAGGLGAVRDTSLATSPSVGGGGGGGGYGPGIYGYGLAANGGKSTYWTAVDGSTAGPSGGGGGGSEMGDGGIYGGGSGGGLNNVREGKGGQGLIVFTYNVAATASSTPYSVGQSGVANYVNTTSSAVTKVVANNGLGSYSPVVIGSGGAVNIPVTFSANQSNVRINVVDIAGYKTGISNITITVNAGVNIYSSVSTSPALLIYGANTGDTVTLINNGNIIGYGGNGGSITVSLPYAGYNSTYLPTPGYTALSTLSNLTLVNNGNICGGGGGGGTGGNYNNGYLAMLGGGGAGGGTGSLFGTRTVSFTNPGPNGIVSDQSFGCCCFAFYYGGGSGGYIISNPTGGSIGTITNSSDQRVGIGGNAGGSGAVDPSNLYFTYTPGNDGGGTGNAPAPNALAGTTLGGGGGGFGGSGANGSARTVLTQVGAVGGYAITKNGRTVTVTGSGNIYGTQLP